MDQALAVAEAIAIATLIGALLQERFLSRFEGKTAYALSVLVSLGVGIVAVARTGGFELVAQTSDPFSFGIAVLALAGTVLAASKAAFTYFVKPIAK